MLHVLELPSRDRGIQNDVDREVPAATSLDERGGVVGAADDGQTARDAVHGRLEWFAGILLE